MLTFAHWKKPHENRVKAMLYSKLWYAPMNKNLMICHEISYYSIIFQCYGVGIRMLWCGISILCYTIFYVVKFLLVLTVKSHNLEHFIKFLTSLFLSHMPLDTTCWQELLLWRPHCHIQTKFHCKVFPAYLGFSPVQTTTDLRCLKSKINVRLLLYLSKTRYSYITKRNLPSNIAIKKTHKVSMRSPTVLFLLFVI